MRTARLSIILLIVLMMGCAVARPALPPTPEVVAKPVYSCPTPPAIDAPYEPIYELVAADAAVPDKVLKSASATIGSLEASLDECRSALEVYRKPIQPPAP